MKVSDLVNTTFAALSERNRQTYFFALKKDCINNNLPYCILGRRFPLQDNILSATMNNLRGVHVVIFLLR